MIDAKLEELIAQGQIASYSYVEVDENGNVGVRGEFRNTERLVIRFLNGTVLTLDAFCSGSAENVTFSIN